MPSHGMDLGYPSLPSHCGQGQVFMSLVTPFSQCFPWPAPESRVWSSGERWRTRRDGPAEARPLLCTPVAASPGLPKLSLSGLRGEEVVRSGAQDKFLLRLVMTSLLTIVAFKVSVGSCCGVGSTQFPPGLCGEIPLSALSPFSSS